MARPIKNPSLLTPEKKQEIRKLFLKELDALYIEAFDSLASDVLSERLTLSAWANRFKFTGTWVQDAARYSVDFWRCYPESEREWKLESKARNSAESGFDAFQPISLTVHVPSLLSSWNFEVKRLKGLLNKNEQLLAIKKAATEAKLAEEASIPEEKSLIEKIDCYILHNYLEWKMDDERFGKDKSNVSRAIAEVTELLDLP